MGTARRLSVLVFHRVHATPDPLFPGEPDAARFAAYMEVVRDAFTPMALQDACRALTADTLPPRAVAITFDDGYADNCDIALPILERLGIPATFFVASDFLDGGRMWNDTVIESIRACPATEVDLDHLSLGRHSLGDAVSRHAAIESIIGRLKYVEPEERATRAEAIGAGFGVTLRNDLMMTSTQLRRMAAAGMSIGAHTCSHPILARIESDDARREILEGRERLEAIVRQPIRLFAYPNGKPERDYARLHVDMVRKEGFEAAVSTAHGAASPGSDLWQIPRFTPWARGSSDFGLKLALSRRVHRYATC